MTERIELKYINEGLQIGMVDIKQVYQLSPVSKLLVPEVYRGKLVYRAKGSTKRVTYEAIKQGLVKKRKVVEQEAPNWLYASP